jgi:hypothetical protein
MREQWIHAPAHQQDGFCIQVGINKKWPNKGPLFMTTNTSSLTGLPTVFESIDGLAVLSLGRVLKEGFL